MIKIGNVLQKMGNKWPSGEVGEYVVIVFHDTREEVFYYRYECEYPTYCQHEMSGPWTIEGLERDFKFIKE